MLPRITACEICGERSYIRAYGRMEYDWDRPGEIDAELLIKSINLIIDCPKCGIRSQVYHPEAGVDLSAQHLA